MSPNKVAKLYEKIHELGYKTPALEESRTNPYTGDSHTLTPELVRLYDFITTNKHTCGEDYTRADWDAARRLFLELNPDAYYDLID